MMNGKYMCLASCFMPSMLLHMFHPSMHVFPTLFFFFFYHQEYSLGYVDSQKI